jgi:hypothetical protein
MDVRDGSCLLHCRLASHAAAEHTTEGASTTEELRKQVLSGHATTAHAALF